MEIALQHAGEPEPEGSGSTSERVMRLHSLGISEPVADEALDRFAYLAAQITDAPVAMINFISERRQMLCGLSMNFAPGKRDQRTLNEADLIERREMPLSYSFCQYVIAHGILLSLDDIYSDPRFIDNPAVREYGYRSYMGVPLIDDTGMLIGTLSVADHEPRLWGESRSQALKALAQTITSEIRLRDPRFIDMASLKRIMDELPRPIMIMSGDENLVVYVNPEFNETFQRSEIGVSASELLSDLHILGPVQKARVSRSQIVVDGMRFPDKEHPYVVALGSHQKGSESSVVMIWTESLKGADTRRELSSLVSLIVSRADVLFSP